MAWKIKPHYENERPVQVYRETYVSPYSRGEITRDEQALMGQVVNSVGTVMADRQTSHMANSSETPITSAVGSLIYSLAYAVAGGMITFALVLILFWIIGGDEEVYMVLFLLLWGACFLGSLAYNRWQGLHFSPAGLQHHEIESRERIALHIIDRHLDLLEKKWLTKD